MKILIINNNGTILTNHKVAAAIPTREPTLVLHSVLRSSFQLRAGSPEKSYLPLGSVHAQIPPLKPQTLAYL